MAEPEDHLWSADHSLRNAVLEESPASILVMKCSACRDSSWLSELRITSLPGLFQQHYTLVFQRLSALSSSHF